MTKILLIEGDDDIIADLRAKIENSVKLSERMRIVGLFHVMRTRCTCPDDITGRHHGKLSSRGPRFLWWVHRGCGKPTGGLHSPLGNLINHADVKPRGYESGPEIVVDSITIHDYGFYNHER